MTTPPPRPSELVGRLIGGVLLFGSLTALGVAVILQRSMEPQGTELISWAAVGLALVAPAVALSLRRAGTGARGADEARAVLSRRIAFLAILEGAVLACAVALVVAPLQWPLLAALVPLALMLVDVALG